MCIQPGTFDFSKDDSAQGTFTHYSIGVRNPQHIVIGRPSDRSLHMDLKV